MSCIGQDVIINDEGVTFDDVPDLPQGYWHFDGPAYLSIPRISQAFDVSITSMPKDPRVSWWLQYTQSPRLDLIIGRRKALQHVKSMIETSIDLIGRSSYFRTMFQRQNLLLDSFQGVYADKSRVDELGLTEVIPFADPRAGLCKVPVYDNFSSSTGRMSIKSGPKILNLNRQHRHVFKSRWGDEGSLLGIDFTSLEPRVIMSLLGEDVSSTDIYTLIASKAGLHSLDRDTIKLMILSILYGMTRKNFIVKFIMTQDPDVSYDRIGEVIGVKKILEKIRREMSGDTFKNHYGRPLKCDQNLMINYFTQSSAVDVACDGFLNLVEENGDAVTPVFLIHDELVIDIHNRDREQIDEYCRNGIRIPSLETSFPVKVKVFNGREDH